jgi:hypothetical protein
MYVGFLVPKDVLIDELERLKKEHEEKFKLYKEYEATFFSDVKKLQDKGKYRYLNLRMGINFESGHIKWCDEAIDFLKEEID